jgi:hypothetical protein
MQKRLSIFIILISIFLIVVPNVTASDNSCIDCHKTISPFIEIQKQFNQIRIEHLEKNVTCSLECHEDRVRQLATANYQQWSDSVHALKGVTCEICHGGDPKMADKTGAHNNILKRTDPGSPVYYTNVPKTCGKCHSKELDNFQSSKHYQKLEALKLAPTCTTCHAPHRFTVLDPEEFRNFCGNCHSVYKKVAPYDIPVKAEYLMSSVNKLKFNIDMVNQDIFLAKKNGTDVTQAQIHADNALGTLSSLAVLWHEFNLTHFEVELDRGNAEIKKVENIVKPEATSQVTAKARDTPGFAGVSMLISMAAVLFLIGRNRD